MKDHQNENIFVVQTDRQRQTDRLQVSVTSLPQVRVNGIIIIINYTSYDMHVTV